LSRTSRRHRYRPKAPDGKNPLRCPLKITRSNVSTVPEMDRPCSSRKLFRANPETVAVVHWHARLEISSPQVKFGLPQGGPLWLRPQAALWIVA
jgi:hypothetical protein